jgi:alpha-1,3-rhamnosyl/mannosyltransferase
MRIGVDARWIFREISGIGTYVRELVRHLAAVDSKNEYVLFFSHPSTVEEIQRSACLDDSPNFSTVLLGYGPFDVRSQLLLPSLLHRLRLDIFHSPNYMIPFLAFGRRRAQRPLCVVNLHDVIPLLFPHFTRRSKKTRFMPVYRGLMREVGRRADLIITGSECAREDILRELRIDNTESVAAIPDGVDSRFTPSDVPSVDSKTVLYVGRLDPYKNVPGLVEAFSKVLRTGVPDARLRIVGPRDPRYPEAPRLASELGIDSSVEWAGYLTDPQLLEAYRQAAVLALPSFYEGFGLPVVEAMACGTPVVCSNAASLPEVAADAAIMVDPGDTDQLAQELTRVLTDSALRLSLREKGLRRAAEFSWQRTAELTLQAYSRVLGGVG